MKKLIKLSLLLTVSTYLIGGSELEKSSEVSSATAATAAWIAGNSVENQKKRKEAAQEELWTLIKDQRGNHSFLRDLLKQSVKYDIDLNEKKEFPIQRGEGGEDTIKMETLTPLDYAIIFCSERTVELLKKHGAKSSTEGLKFLWRDVETGRFMFNKAAVLPEWMGSTGLPRHVFKQQEIDADFLRKIRTVSQSLKVSEKERLALKKLVQDKYVECVEKCANLLDYEKNKETYTEDKKACAKEQDFAAYLAALNPQVKTWHDDIPLKY